MKTVIIEDEQSAATHLEKLLHHIDKSIEIMEKLDTVRSSIKWLSEHQPDLIFLDIHLADGISFQIFEKIRVEKPVIFTTAYDQYAIKAFKINSIDYLLKPIAIDNLQQSLTKYHQLNQHALLWQNDIQNLIKQLKADPEYQKRFVVYAGNKIKTIKTSDIAYFFSSEKITFLTTFANKQYTLNYSLDKIESLLNPNDFYRINRNYLIHFDAIQQMHNLSKSRIKIDLNPKPTENVMVSIRRINDFKNWLNQ